MGFDFAALVEPLPRLLNAAVTNLAMAIAAVVIALAGGTILTVLRTLRIRPLNFCIGFMISFIRGTPILIQIFLFYYGLPVLGLDLPPTTAGIAAIAFNSMIFVTEIMRGGLAGMEPGPIEAAIALGMRKYAIWTKVVLPQLYLRILPPLVNEFTIIVKGTTLLSVITVVEILRTAQQLGSATFRPLEPILAAAIILFMVNFTISRCGNLVEARVSNRRG